ncbi:hypothetical protein [Parerythrobacter aestuarii]|uniref:hypothetical protein n=1 Tax=Parerythrobacter aestuarii TaxID=3020909 RepID=UPI0024DEE843|nr:hypothetical protein [Parerythrobacter aestuarii]
MREILFGAAMVAGVGGAVYLSPGAGHKVYAMTAQQAIAKVGAADRRYGKAPFYSMDVATRKTDERTLVFESQSSHAGHRCVVVFEEAGEGQVYAESSCGASQTSNAIAGTTLELTEIAFREFVASTLEGRAFNEDMVKAANAGAVLKNMPKMQQQALETQRQFEQMEADIDNGGYGSDDDGWGEGTN